MAAKTLSGAGVLYTDRRDFYLSPQVVKELWTDVTPFTTLVSNRRQLTGLSDPVFKLFEHRDPWIKQEFVISTASESIPVNNSESNALTISGTPVGLATTADSSWLGLVCEVWDTTRTTKKGVVLITTASTTIKAKCLGATAITTAASDVFIVIGNAHGEGVESPEAWADELSVVWGACQIFRTPIEITGTLYQAALRGYSDELARLRLQKSKTHKMQIERSLLFGMSPIGLNLTGADTFNDTVSTNAYNWKGDVNSKTVRTTMGLIAALDKYGVTDTTSDDQNIFSVVSATYKYSDFVDDMEKVFRYFPESMEKYAFCGPGALSYWSKLDGSMFMAGKSGWQVKISAEQKDTLGFKVRVLETPHGVLKLVNTPALRGVYNKYMVIPSDENLVNVQYRPDMFRANIKTDNAYDGVKDEYFSDLGLGMTLLESHKLFKIS